MAGLRKKKVKKQVLDLNGSDLINAVADESEYTRNTVKDVCSAFLAKLRENIVAGNSVTIKTFGTFSSKVRAARTGRNPITGESLEIPDRMTIKFKPSVTMKKEVNE